MGNYYILENKEPKEADLLQWAKFFESHNRVVDNTDVGLVNVSTVFLGINHSFSGGPPLLFETMIFGGKEDQYTERYSTWDEAVKGHQRACKLAAES